MADDSMYAVKFPNGTQARIVPAKGRKDAIAKALQDQVRFSCYNEGTISSNLYVNGECIVYELDEGVKYDLNATMDVKCNEKKEPKK